MRNAWKPSAGKRRRDAEAVDRSRRQCLGLEPSTQEARLQGPPARATHPIDFTLENPAPPGKLFFLPAVRALYDEAAHEPWGLATAERLSRAVDHRTGPCVRVTTSYCKYGTPYRKNTCLLTSLSALALPPPCAAGAPCAVRQADGQHPLDVQGCSAAMRNSVPAELTRALLRAFVARQRALGRRVFVVADLFSGWGSVATAAAAAVDLLGADERLFVWTNDIARRADHPADQHLDMQRFGVRLALRICLVQLEERLQAAGVNLPRHRAADLSVALDAERVAVLLHCSVPCTTYSTAAGDTHRAAGCIEPTSELARSHDALVRTMVDGLVDVCRL